MKYRITTEKVNAEGIRVHEVEAESRREAIEKFIQNKFNIIDSEVEYYYDDFEIEEIG